MGKVRRQTFTLSMYLQKVQDMDIRSDADVQRLSGAWNNVMSSELVCSILNNEFMPALILGQEENSQSWIVDGLQRTSTLMMFRYGNLKISPNIEDPIIEYRAKVRDADGEVKIDGCGDICWETRTFDLRRKTYDKLPEELKKKFDEYQTECVIHENYSMQQISRLVRRFNFNKGMTVSQKTFTFCDTYARRIREILKRKFFIEAPYSKGERKNGTVERVVMESVMCMFHLDSWKKSGQIGAYINENASAKEFDILENCIERLENIVTDDTYNLFTSRDSFLLFSLFHKFTGLGLEDGKFAYFLHAFKEGLCDKEIDGKVFYEKGRSLKDKPVIVEKLDLLETLMREYLDIPKTEEDPESGSEMGLGNVLEFVREMVSPYVTLEDVSQYVEILDCLAGKSSYGGKLLEEGNRISMLAVISYAFENDLDLDDWFADYCSRNDDYIADQTENFERMTADLQQYLDNLDATCEAA